MIRDNVVITGAGLVCSLGHSPSEVWEALLSGKSGIKQIEGFDASGFACRVAAQVEGLDAASLGIHPRDARIMDKHSYMLMKCTQDAFTNAGLGKISVSGEDIGFFAGMGMVDYNIEDLMPAVLKSMDPEGNMDYDAFYFHGFQEIHPLWPLSMLNNITFCQVAIKLGLRGENTVFSPHADSGAQAIAEGMRALCEKKARILLAGGVSEKVSPMSLARGHLTGQLSPDNECRPFSEHRKGTIPGEGCGILALELRSSADERGIPYSARLTGYGAGCEIDEIYSGPAAKAIAGAMEKALADAGLQPSDVDLVMAHGDGTLQGDKNEMEALACIFSKAVSKPAVFSTKANLGHLLAGAPAVDIILAMQILENGIIPEIFAAPAYKNIIPGSLNTWLLKKHPERIMINCRSYEGQCASLIIEAA